MLWILAPVLLLVISLHLYVMVSLAKIGFCPFASKDRTRVATQKQLKRQNSWIKGGVVVLFPTPNNFLLFSLCVVLVSFPSINITGTCMELMHFQVEQNYNRVQIRDFQLGCCNIFQRVIMMPNPMLGGKQPLLPGAPVSCRHVVSMTASCLYTPSSALFCMYAGMWMQGCSPVNPSVPPMLPRLTRSSMGTWGFCHPQSNPSRMIITDQVQTSIGYEPGKVRGQRVG